MSRLSSMLAASAAALTLLAVSVASAAPPTPAPKPKAKPCIGEGCPGVTAAARPVMPVAKARQDLVGADVEAAVQAARSLGQPRGAPSVAALLDALAMGVAPEVAAAALEALREQRDPKSFDTVAVYANHRAPRVRTAAVAALGALDDARAAALVVAALADVHASVRNAAVAIVGERRMTKAIPALVTLFKGGDEATAPALARMADPEVARTVAEQIGQAPDALVARCLGEILRRPDFKPEEARVEVVRALGKVPGDGAVAELTAYVASIPENPPRQSRREAEQTIESRIGGGK